MSPLETAFDLVEELRLRRWARENYVTADDRDETWPWVVQDEMRQRDAELTLQPECRRQGIVPLAPFGDRAHGLRGPQSTGGMRYAVGEPHYT